MGLFSRLKEKKIQKGKEYLAQYVSMMNEAEENCDPKLAYEAWNIGMKAAKILGYDSIAEAKYYYYKD